MDDYTVVHASNERKRYSSQLPFSLSQIQGVNMGLSDLSTQHSDYHNREQRSLLSLAAKKDKVFQGDKGKYKPSKRTYHPRRASVDWETEREAELKP
ncbi:hypothetical protein Y1Q_0000626 [Alligator mississippiensis]|uniref:Uncharacterized protein n=1 Tax=Alligator mississippiensis TaxID=8496 RepID=A0A151MBW3_ALLMI|nr:hypothetical protein Y1Q_0000626 [Alligator mississippiensis]